MVRIRRSFRPQLREIASPWILANDYGVLSLRRLRALLAPAGKQVSYLEGSCADTGLPGLLRILGSIQGQRQAGRKCP